MRLIAVARYVALGYDTGGGFVSEFDPGFTRDATPEDRRAYEEVRKLLERWRPFVIVSRTGDAELLIGVRAGRFLTVGGGTYGGAMAPAGDAGQSRQIQVSTPLDMLTVRDRSGSVLWRQQLSGGFSDPEVPLFERLRAAVDAASRRPEFLDGSAARHARLGSGSVPDRSNHQAGRPPEATCPSDP